MTQPYVKVIAYTKFIDVPFDLFEDLNDIAGDIFDTQDKGSDAARLIECSGRTCYDSYGKGRSSGDFHKHILEVGHGSVLEHASLSFYISGVSRGLTHELVRHRAGCAISQRSTRYVDESESRWAWHPLLDNQLDSEKTLAKVAAQNMYSRFVKTIQENLMNRGVDAQTARKQARGAARGVLGSALETSLVWTANIRALRNVIEQRASRFADAEIRLLANQLYEEAYQYCPEYLSDYEKADCPDGIGYELTTKYRKV